MCKSYERKNKHRDPCWPLLFRHQSTSGVYLFLPLLPRPFYDPARLLHGGILPKLAVDRAREGLREMERGPRLFPGISCNTRTYSVTDIRDAPRQMPESHRGGSRVPGPSLDSNSLTHKGKATVAFSSQTMETK